VSLHNGLETFIVTGPSKALLGLVMSLRKIRAPSRFNQSKTPFSQQKPVFSLLVGVPYHSDYLDGAADTVFEEDLEDEKLWEAKDSKMPVYNAEDGTFL
jgi:fatty acid synthase subunit alpha, fungi type